MAPIQRLGSKRTAPRDQGAWHPMPQMSTCGHWRLSFPCGKRFIQTPVDTHACLFTEMESRWGEDRQHWAVHVSAPLQCLVWKQAFKGHHSEGGFEWQYIFPEEFYTWKNFLKGGRGQISHHVFITQKTLLIWYGSFSLGRLKQIILKRGKMPLEDRASKSMEVWQIAIYGS